MKRKHQILIMAGMFVLIFLLWNGWYLINMPDELSNETITDITITVLTETGPVRKKMTSAEDIDAFVRLFNTFKITPRINAPGFGGGWLINARIIRTEFPGDVTLLFLGQTISANGKRYNINTGAVEELRELFLQDDFGELQNVHETSVNDYH